MYEEFVMDYKYYRGENTKLQEFLFENRKYLRLLEPLGLIVFLAAILINFFIVIKLFENSLTLSVTSYFMMLFGTPIHFIGKSYNNVIDLSD